MGKIVFSGHQPNFLPYMGVFYKMHKSDVFVLDDDVQYSSGGLHNANFLKINGVRSKITIPVNVDFGQNINQVEICYERAWKDKLLKSISMNYSKSDFFNDGYEFIERYLSKNYTFLCDMNIEMIKEIAKRMGIKAKIIIASKDVPTDLKNNSRNIFQCKKLNGDIYYSGIGGKDYNDESMYKKNGITLVYSDYEPFEYKQKGKLFIPNLSILDYILNNGFVMPEKWK